MPKAPDIAAENAASAGAFASAPAGVGVEVGAPPGRRPFLLFRGPWWIVLVIVGLATVALAVLIPLREANGRLAHALADTERERAYVEAQAEANAAFLRQIQEDPALLARVTMRMTNRPAAGTRFLDGAAAGERPFASSPYAMTQVAAPPPGEPYRSDLPPAIRALFGSDRPRLVMLASGVFLLAAALVLGGNTNRMQIAE